MAQVLYQPHEKLSPIRTVIKRLALLLCLYLVVLGFFWWDRDGLRDSTKPPGEPVTTLDLIYFTAVTMSTVGYGDIVPVTPLARTIDLLLVTPARMLVWLLFVGTTVQLTYAQFKEEYAMQKLKDRLKAHTIICGYGMTGRSAAEELVLMGSKRDEIVIVDIDESECQTAADDGFVAIKGDATREAVLENADIRDASHIIVTTNRDDTNVLICLTAKNMNPEIRIAAGVDQTENLKLMKSSGAATTVMPSMAGGHILAASTQYGDLVAVLEDLLTMGGSLRMLQRTVTKKEVGKRADELKDVIVVGIERDGRKLSISDVKRAELIEGDVMVCMVDAGKIAKNKGPGEAKVEEKTTKGKKA